MSIGTIITLIGIFILFLYTLVQLLDFYKIGLDVYAIYIYFCLLILFCFVFLPHRKEL
jgi:hypothetical protein